MKNYDNLHSKLNEKKYKNLHSKLNEKCFIVCIQNKMKKIKKLIYIRKPLFRKKTFLCVWPHAWFFDFRKKWFWMDFFVFDFYSNWMKNYNNLHSKLNEKKYIKIYILNWMRKSI
jgi:hypothetical protein